MNCSANTSQTLLPRHRFTALLILLSFSLFCQTASTTTSSVSHVIFPGHLQKCNISTLPWRGGGSSTSMLSTPTLLARRRVTHKNSADASSIQNVVRRKYRKPAPATITRVAQKQPDQPTLDELRAQLGPVALLLSNTIELTVITLGSLISGGLLGYLGGGILNIPSALFDKTADGILSRMSLLHAKAWGTCKQWGMLSASFSGFHNFVRMVRGDVEDGWNAVWGSALTGAFLNRGGGAQAMLQGAATYAGFTYFLDKFFASPSSQQRQQQGAELMYTDIPLED
ncbi:hypothetical protein ACHAW6_000518 [Cyclotella cf. meneghiniana]